MLHHQLVLLWEDSLEPLDAISELRQQQHQAFETRAVCEWRLQHLGVRIQVGPILRGCDPAIESDEPAPRRGMSTLCWLYLLMFSVVHRHR